MDILSVAVVGSFLVSGAAVFGLRLWTGWPQAQIELNLQLRSGLQQSRDNCRDAVSACTLLQVWQVTGQVRLSNRVLETIESMCSEVKVLMGDLDQCAEDFGNMRVAVLREKLRDLSALERRTKKVMWKARLLGWQYAPKILAGKDFAQGSFQQTW